MAAAVVSDSGSTATAAEAVQLNMEGMRLLKVNQLSAARDAFLNASTILFRATTTPSSSSGVVLGAAPLLSNRCAALLRTDDPEDAAMDALTSLCLGISDCRLRCKVHLRFANAMLALSDFDAAAWACSQPIASCDEEETAINSLRRRIESARAGSEASANARQKREAKKIQRKNDISVEDVLQNLRGAYSGVASTATLNAFHATLTPEQTAKITGSPLLRLVRSDVPRYHEEIALRGEWPPGVDMVACTTLLSNAYHFEISNMHEVSMVSAATEDKWPLKDGMLERLGLYGPETLAWWARAPFGDVRPRARNQYNTPIVHNFTNTPNTTEILTVGTVHVAVGFVDLGVLQWAILRPGSATQHGPLRWIGVEMCAFNVAKALVVASMLTPDSGAAVHEVLQVWYSSTWSTHTHRAFRSALNTVVASRNPRSAEVEAYLSHWQKSDVSVKSARRLWLQAWNAGGSPGLATGRV